MRDAVIRRSAHHVLHEDFAADIALSWPGHRAAARLELRISSVRHRARRGRPAVSRTTRRAVVSTKWPRHGSLDLLAVARSGDCLDRAWVTALRSDAVARKVCRAGIGMAAALVSRRSRPASTIHSTRRAVALGCRLGSATVPDAAADITAPPRAVARA